MHGNGSSGNGALGLGVGLANLEQRIRSFGGEDATVSAAPNDRGFEVMIRWRDPAGGEG
jgi:signal transduction histidine kinase